MLVVGMPKNTIRETVHADGLPPPSSTPASADEVTGLVGVPLTVANLEEAKHRQTGRATRPEPEIMSPAELERRRTRR